MSRYVPVRVLVPGHRDTALRSGAVSVTVRRRQAPPASGGPKLKAMATANRRGSLEVEAKRRDIIRLRFEGNSLERTAELVGLAGASSVKYHEDAWLAERTPTAEVTEQRRQMQLAAIDSVRARLFDHIEDEDGRPDVAIVDRIAKLWEREAKLVGLDLQPGIGVAVVTREQLAALLYDAQNVVEGTAEEITDA